MESVYLASSKSGLLDQRIGESKQLLRECTLCPRQCKVDRLAQEHGLCRTGALAEVASYGPHFGEESVLVGEQGSGTIFFCGCSLLCNFCQNYDISHPDKHVDSGNCLPATAEQLAQVMVELQERGCHNINLVTPGHVVPQILAALPFAIDLGLTAPLVYNSSGYDSVTTLQLLDNIVDIYMPDFKFWSEESAKRYTKAADYPETARLALKEMQRQVGDLQISSEGYAQRGLLVRHLLMPGAARETEAIIQFLAEEISRDCYVNIMAQYHPAGKAAECAELTKSISSSEYKQALQWARDYGLTRLDQDNFSNLVRKLFDS